MFVVITEWVKSEIGNYGLWAVFLGMVIESACIPLPSEIIMPVSGLLVSTMAKTGSFNIWTVTLAGTLGNVVGGIIAYYVGKTGGRKFVIKYGRFIFMSEKHLNHAEAWFKKRGEWTVFLSRMLPGVRTFISLPAGVAHMNFGRFVAYTFLGSLPWALVLTYLGYFFGRNWDVLSGYLHEANFVLWGLGLVVLGLYYLRRKKRIKGKSKS